MTGTTAGCPAALGAVGRSVGQDRATRGVEGRCSSPGQVGERLKPPVSKTGMPARASRVRIPPCPSPWESNSTLVYVGARTLLAGAMIALLLRRRVGPWYAGGQVVSDLSCAAFLLAYVNPDIRDDIGLLVVPLLLFVLYWEATRFLDNRSAAAAREDEETTMDTVLRVYGSAWAFGFVVPAVLAGGFLMFDVLAPGQWPFPNPRPGLVCDPARLDPGTHFTLRMRVPHGAELSVFTPTGRSLVVVPFLRKGTQPRGSGFAY